MSSPQEETHPGWLLIRANRVQSTGTRLFDSEITHHQYVKIEIDSCLRKRALQHDWIHPTKTRVIINLSMAQWGAFVSSFGDGGGVPATLEYFEGEVDGIPLESRFDESIKDIKGATIKGMDGIQKAFAAVEEARAHKAGKKEMDQLMFNLRCMINNIPANMAFAANTLTEHAENVVAKSRADIEAMMVGFNNNATNQLEKPSVLELNAYTEVYEGDHQ